MSRYSKTDKILLGVMLPLFAVVFALHLREVVRTGIAQAPFYAAPASEPGGYPSVGGPRLEHGIDRSGLELGDALIRAGDIDLAGAGYFGFDALVVEAAGADARTTLVYERDGQRRATELELIPYPQPWMRVPFLFATALVATLVLARVPRNRDAQRFFFAGMCLAIFELHFFGGSRWQSYASLVIFNFGGGVAMWALLRWIIAFPDEVPDEYRISPRWAWLGALFVLVRIEYLLGGPLPSHLVPFAVLLSDGFFLVLMTGILTWNTWHATAVGRRRLKWILLGAYLTTVPMLLSLLPPFIGIEGIDFFHTLPIGLLFGAVFPLTIWIAIVRFDLFDIDRVLSSTAAYSLTIGLLLAGVVVLAPRLAGALSRTSGIDEQLALMGLAGALVLAAPLLVRGLRPRFERLFFPERSRREAGFRRLMLDLASCRSVDETLQLLVDRLKGILDPQFVLALVRDRGRLVALETSPRSSLASLPARGQLALGLEAHPEPLAWDDGSLQRRVAALPADEQAALADTGVQVIVPVRQANALVALLCIGAARSGDIYPSTLLTLLGAAAERASAELSRIADASSLEREREYSRRLRSLKEAAEDANRGKSRFLAAASHDLRQPLQALSLFVAQLQTQTKGEEISPLVERIRSSTDSLQEMFSALLDLSRLDAGGVEPRFGNVELDRLFARLESELSPQALEKGLRLSLRSQGEIVWSDPQLLVLILQNLGTNAIRYTERGSVTISARREGGRVEIAVEDTGIGIPEEFQRGIFDEFVRLETSEGQGEGIGLGLSIVDRLARLLSHRLRLESTPGVGTRFTLEVPPGTRGETRSERRPDASDLRGARIVVLDDDLPILEGLRSTLQGWGCSVIVATTCDDALEGIERRGAPQAILADYDLGAGGTGLDAIERIRELLGRQIPAAVLTGDTSGEVMGELERSGLVHLTKPIAPSSLRAALSELLRHG